MLGQDNDEVLGTLLGFDEAERARLADDGVVDRPVRPEVRLRRPYADWARYIVRDAAWVEVDS